jgi:hypothetical protein
MRKLATFVLSMYMFLPLIARAAEAPSVPSVPSVDSKQETIVLEGVITGATIEPLMGYLDNILSGKKKAPANLNMVISSPGGSVTAGFLFLDRMKAVQAKGTVVKCYVADVAASMAFQILLQCDERYSLNTSFLLWHRARVQMGGLFGSPPMTGPELYAIGVQLKDLDDHIYRDVVTAFGPDIPDHYIRFHFEQQTLHTGSNLANAVPEFISAVPSISGLYEALNNAKLIRTQKQGLFDVIFRRGELIYISPEYEASQE